MENKSKTNITNELTNGEVERRQAGDECTKIIINIIRYYALLKNKSMIRLKQA